MSPASEALLSNQIEWAYEMYRVMDEEGLAVFDRFYAEDVQLNFANLPSMVSKKHVLEHFGYLLSALEKMEHIVGGVYPTNDHVLVSHLIKYRFINGAETEVRAFTVCHKKADEAKATRLELFGDFGEVIRLLGEVYVDAAPDDQLTLAVTYMW
ncbi:hypothetical protein AX16_006208 [Volvariella volvacea WC 439]|nr:hypothetical protein AX16_006208 [Volvariella volvacea WC 439]